MTNAKCNHPERPLKIRVLQHTKEHLHRFNAMLTGNDRLLVYSISQLVDSAIARCCTHRSGNFTVELCQAIVKFGMSARQQLNSLFLKGAVLKSGGGNRSTLEHWASPRPALPPGRGRSFATAGTGPSPPSQCSRSSGCSSPEHGKHQQPFRYTASNSLAAHDRACQSAALE